MSENNFLKGGVFATIIWWLWFKYDEQHQAYAREHIIATIFSCFIALPLARIMALTLPFRPRPLYILNYLVLPYGTVKSSLEGWSSFPSDHSVLFFALSIGLLFISKKIGIFAFIYTTLFIVVPRVYLGFHYPTDIIFGALIGILIGWIANQSIIINKVSKPILRWYRSKPSIFYPLFFVITEQISEMFESSRDMMHASLILIKHILSAGRVL